MSRLALAALACAAGALAADAPTISPFSTAAPGARLPAGWRELRLPGVAFPAVVLVEQGGATVLQVRSKASAGAVAYALREDPAKRPVLAWRWRVDRVLATADTATRAGDDFAARVYVFFDVPESSLAWSERMKVQLARLLHGESLPTAALCYVWDNRRAPGPSRWSPYTDRVRIVVLEAGNERVGQWQAERRDVAADFREAFGSSWRGAVPAITGVAAGNDTDQTGEAVTAWFGDFRLEPAP